MDTISALPFLKKLCDPCDRVCINKQVVMKLVSNVTMELATSSLEALHTPKKISATEEHNESLSLYVEVVNCLLTTYVTEDIVGREIKNSRFFNRVSKVSGAFNAKRLYSKAQRFVIIYDEKCIKSPLVEKLEELVCNNMRVFLDSILAHH